MKISPTAAYLQQSFPGHDLDWSWLQDQLLLDLAHIQLLRDGFREWSVTDERLLLVRRRPRFGNSAIPDADIGVQIHRFLLLFGKKSSTLQNSFRQRCSCWHGLVGQRSKLSRRRAFRLFEKDRLVGIQLDHSRDGQRIRRRRRDSAFGPRRC